MGRVPGNTFSFDSLSEHVLISNWPLTSEGPPVPVFFQSHNVVQNRPTERRNGLAD